MPVKSWLILAWVVVPAWAVSVTTANYDLARTNTNTSETMLTQANVGTLTLRYSLPVTAGGEIWGQPLVIENVSGMTLVVVQDSKNVVYAWNVANLGGDPVWTRDFLANNKGANEEITSTMVADTSTNRLYLVTQQSDLSYKLRCLNLATGTDAVTAVTISATAGSNTFTASRELSRPGMVLANGNVYIGFSADVVETDNVAFQGWLLSYDKTTLVQNHVFCTVTNTGGAYSVPPGGAGIWMSGGAPAVDSNGNLYFITGNGGWDGASNYGESFLKLSSALAVLDFFTPADWAMLNTADHDLGSGRGILISDSVIVGGGKNTELYLLRTGDMGHLEGGGGTAPIQTIAEGVGGLFVGSMFSGSDLYISNAFGGGDGKIRRYHWNGTTFDTPAAAVSAVSYTYPGAVLVYTSNGATAGTGIVWALASTSSSFPKAAKLVAYNPSTLAVLWTSDNADAVGSLNRYSTPTITNGLVFVPTASGQLRVYGLPSAASSAVGVSGKAGVSGKVVLQ